MNTFGTLLRDLRIERSLSQMQLSEACGISQSSIARFELDKTEPRLSEIRIFCRFFNVTADYLLGLTDD